MSFKPIIMTLDFVGYAITIVGLALILTAIGYLFGKKNKAIKNLFILLALGVMIGNRWICPNVYIVNECGQVIEEYMILPTNTIFNTPMTYGSHCYLINNSSSRLSVETVFYGDKTPENSADDTITAIVPPKSDEIFSTISLDYFFEDVGRTVKTREKGFIKYTVNCMD